MLRKSSLLVALLLLASLEPATAQGLGPQPISDSLGCGGIDPCPPSQGGTGINNGTNTITFGSSIDFTGFGITGGHISNSTAFVYSGGVIAQLGAITGGASYTVSTIIGSLGTITGGSSYTAGTYTSVPLTGGAGSGAVATVIVYGGAVVSVTLTSSGTGFLVNDSLSAAAANIGGTGTGFSVPVSTVHYPAVALTGGAGSGATANIIVAAGGAVSAVTLVNQGTGYVAGNSLSATAASIGGTGSGFSVLVSTVGAPSSAATDPFYYRNPFSGVCSDTGNCVFNTLSVTGDTVDARAAGGTAFAYLFNQNYGGTGAYGGRTTLQAQLNINSVPSDIGKQYTVAGTTVQSSVNVGGTSGTGNGRGSIFGFNPYTRLIAGATNWHQGVGQEIDMSLHSGASADQMIGMQIVQDNLFTVAPNQVGAAYVGSNSLGAVGWDILLADGIYDGYPSLKSTGKIFKCYPHANSGNCGTIDSAFDLSNYSTITTNILNGPGGTFNIDGGFNIAAASLSVTNRVNAAGTGIIQLGNATHGYGFRVNDSGGTTINIASITPGITGAAVVYACGGPNSDANTQCNYLTKGNSSHAFYTENGAVLQFQIDDVASATNHLKVAGAASGPALLTASAVGGMTISGPNTSAASTAAGDISIIGGNATGTGAPSNGANVKITMGTSTNGTAGSLQLVNVTASSAAQAGTYCGSASGASTSSVTIDTTLACLASDERLKNISKFTPAPGFRTACEEEAALVTINYTWKEGTPKFVGDPGEHIGLGAFTTAYADERLIARDEKGNPRGWRQDAMIALGIACRQEQEKRLVELEKRVTK